MKRFALIAIAALAMLAAGTPAMAGSWLHPASHSTTVQVGSGCGGRVVGTPDTPKWRYEAEWTSNPSPPCYLRATLECRNPFTGQTAWYHAGGWVKGLRIEDGVNCGAAVPVQAGIDWAHQPGAPWTYLKMYSWSPPRLVANANSCGNFRYAWKGDTTTWKFETRWVTNEYFCYQWSSLRCNNGHGDESWSHGGHVQYGAWSGVNCNAGFGYADRANFNYQAPGNNFYTYFCVWLCGSKHHSGIFYLPRHRLGLAS